MSSKAAIVSPHLDDAVLSCAGFLSRHAGTLVITVLAGYPEPAVEALWDKECGFADSQTAMDARRREDLTALSRVAARAEHLGFLDAQYQPQRPNNIEVEIGNQLLRLIEQYEIETLLFPLGLHHPDHLLVSDATLNIASHTGARLIAYADLPYAISYPHEVEPRLQGYRASRVIEPVVYGTAAEKRDLVMCYQSQIEPLRASFPGSDPVAATWEAGAEWYYALLAPRMTSVPG